MVKYIQKLLRILKIEMAVVWLIVVAAVVLGELDVIPNGWVVPQSPEEVKLNIAAVVLTIVGISVCSH